MTKKTWNVKSKDGRMVKIKYNSHDFSEGDPCPHLEFNGYETSETGYHSHYFGDFREGAKEPTLKQVRNLISELMEAFYTPPQPLSLFK